MKVGYVRVSTEEQNTIRQEVLMHDLGVDKIFIDKASGKNTARRELQNMLEFVRVGDTVIVESYSRLARSTRDLLDIVETLKSKGVEFISKKESIDTCTPAGRLMLTIFAGLYQFERECTLERQAEGIAEAKKAGKYKGRKPLDVDADKFKELYGKWKAGRITAVAMQKELGLTAPTFYRRVKAYEGK
ncbi:MAG: recombinase family protein [Oscillospiraceae bacterium]|jgi:DNA invertase Pin-like site-specific DNA recombinase|nr:recombinase family protein [Oscillospiraceae bacterium]